MAKSITQCVHEYISNKPFLSESLQDGIINYSALAEHIQPEIESVFNKKIKSGSINMALRRFNPNQGKLNQPKLMDALKQLNNITIKSDIIIYNYKNSENLIALQSSLLKKITKDNELFYGFIKGVFETNIIINETNSSLIETLFKHEVLIHKMTNLNSITFHLPKENEKITGFYYMILKQLAWEGINLYDIISTTNEITIFVNKQMTNKVIAAL